MCVYVCVYITVSVVKGEACEECHGTIQKESDMKRQCTNENDTTGRAEEPFSAVFVGGEFAAEEVSQYMCVDKRTTHTYCLNSPQAGAAQLV